MLLVVLEAFALVADGSIPLETESFEVALNLIAGAGHDAGCIDVLDAQQPFPLS
jgi:hypothetical protein